MRAPVRPPKRAIPGALFVVLFAVFARPAWPVVLVLAAAHVHVPLGLALVAAPDRRGRHTWSWRAARFLQLPAAMLLAGAFYADRGPLAAALAVPWLLVTVLIALFGVRRLLARGPGPSEELCVDMGLIYLAVGGAWAVIGRAVEEPFGFTPLITLLTAAHFHYAGFCLCTLAGLVGRTRAGGTPAIVLVAVLGGIVTLALGITFWYPLERASGYVFGVGGSLVALLQIGRSVRRGAIAQRVLLAVSGACLLPSLVLAILFAGRHFDVAPWLTMDVMVHVHGTANALGFALVGLLGWSLAPPRSRVRPLVVPFSALPGGMSIGKDYFARIGSLRDPRDPRDEPSAPKGIVDAMSDMAHVGLDVTRIPRSVRAFYERTSELDLLVRPTWHGPFVVLVHVMRFVSSRVGQLHLATRESRIRTRVVALDTARDGRPNARGVIRTYEDTGEAMQIIAYGTHEARGTRFMSCAFPMPFGHLAAVLRADAIDVGEGDIGVALTTQPPKGLRDDTGIWFVVRALDLVVRLPFDESLCLWDARAPALPFEPDEATFPGTNLVGLHHMRIFGRVMVTLEYQFRPSAASS